MLNPLIMKPDTPPATVTLLFTDIEGSTRMVQESGTLFVQALSEHRELLEAAFSALSGQIVDTQGDSFFVVFRSAGEAVQAAVMAQRSVEGHEWPEGARIRVRMGMHTGEPDASGGGFVGVDVNRASRIASAAHGGQVLMSAATAALVERNLPPETELRDLGDHRLKDLRGAEHIFELHISGMPADFPPIRSLSAYRNNLPVQLSSFVGREEARKHVAGLVEASRLVTLTGPGGTGKTRLAIEVAASLLDSSLLSDGIWFVDLAAVLDPAFVTWAVAGALGLREDVERPLLETILGFLHERRLLLILDNCEHLIEACVRVTAAVLTEAQSVRILTTGREALGIGGEVVWRVPSLGLPEAGDARLEAAARSEAVRLFQDRARAVRGEFRLTEENLVPVVEICRRLDGIPLALELAASRLRMLSVSDVARRLDDRFRLLTGGSRISLPRQQTLRALIDWSYDLLAEEEQQLLRRLSVFSGGWTLEAAEELGRDAAHDVFSTLSNLVDKSLVLVDDRETTTRYGLLETIRQYARERLVEKGETELARDAHLAYIIARAEEADAALRGGEQRRWLERLDADHDNLRAALEWAASADRTEALLALAIALWRFWRVRSYFSEGRRWLDEALRRSGSAPTAERAKALLRGGSLASYQADYIQATAHLEQALALWREIGDDIGAADTLNVLGSCATMLGRFDAAREMLEESRAIARRIENPRRLAYARFFLGFLYMVNGGFAEARGHCEAALAGLEELHDGWWVFNARLQLAWLDLRDGGSGAAHLGELRAAAREQEDRRGEARALLHLGEAELDSGHVDEAKRRFQESLTLFREVGDTWWEITCLECIASVALAQDDAPSAARLLGACERFHEMLSAPPLPVYRAVLQERIGALGRALPRTSLGKLWAEGRRLTLDRAVALAIP